MTDDEMNREVEKEQDRLLLATAACALFVIGVIWLVTK